MLLGAHEAVLGVSLAHSCLISLQLVARLMSDPDDDDVRLPRIKSVRTTQKLPCLIHKEQAAIAHSREGC